MRILIGLLVVIAGLVALALVAPSFIPTGWVREEIVAQAKAATGRELTIGGDLELAFLPRVSVRASDVAFANAEGAKEPHMATMKALRVDVALLPLLSNRLEVREFVLVEPVINLEVDAKGRPNWEFAAPGGPAKPADAPPDGATPGPEKGQAGEIMLGDVRIENGRASYRSAATGAAHLLEDIDLSLGLPSLAGPLSVRGGLTYNKERLTLEADLASPRDFLAGTPTALELDLNAPVLTLGFEGKLAAVQGGLGVAGQGAANLDVPSVRGLAAFAGSPLAEGEGFGPLALAGDVGLAGDVVSFRKAELGFDGMKGTGDVALHLGGARPRIRGTLALDRLDVTPYANGGAKGGNAGSPGPRGGGGPSSGWSEAPLDFSALKAVDAELDLTVGGIAYNAITIGKSVLAVGLANGMLDATLKELALYKGAGTARLRVDARGAVPVIAQAFSLKGVDARPLLTDAIGFKGLEGLGNLELDVTTRGRSQRELMEALGGTGSLLFNDGAVYGVNLAQIMRNVGSALMSMSFDNTEQKTDFAELSGSFEIVNGVLTNKDLKLLNPLLRVAGEGTASLAAQTVNYRLVPTAVGTLEGQGGKGGDGGLAVPLLITGRWSDLKIGPDPAGLAKSLLGSGLLGGSKPAEGEAGTQAKEGEDKGSVGEQLLRGILGGGKAEPGTPPADGAAPPPAPETPAGPASPAEETKPPAQTAPSEPATPLDQIKGILGR